MNFNLDVKIADLLLADATIEGLAIGGIYAWSQLGDGGLTASNPFCAKAFTKQHGYTLLNPSVVVRYRQNQSTYTRHDDPTQATSFRGSVEFWIYDRLRVHANGAYDSYGTIHNISYCIRKKVHSRSFAGIGLLTHRYSEVLTTAVDTEESPLCFDNYQLIGIIK